MHGLAVAGLGVLVFLCSSDLVFAVRAAGVNIRLGQLLLPLVVLAVYVPAWRSAFARPIAPVISWLVFFAVYIIAAVAAEDTAPALVKAAWGMTNVGLAAALCLSRLPLPKLLSGFALAAVVLAAIVWIDAIGIYWFDTQPLVGLAQASYVFEGRQMLRPHAFFYEPSYMGAMLAFAAPLMLATPVSSRVATALAACVAGAGVITSSRTGTLGLIAGALVFATYGRRLATPQLRRQVLRAVLVTVGIVLAFAIPGDGSRYLRFIAGPLIPSRGALIDDSSSEGRRLENAKWAVRAIAERPLLGRGVARAEDRLIGTSTFNTWLEVAVEAGVLGLGAFAAALFLTIRWATTHAGADLALASTAWFTHLAINLNFTQTFPRLDYWLWFFLAVRLVRNGWIDRQRSATNDRSGALPANIAR